MVELTLELLFSRYNGACSVFPSFIVITDRHSFFSNEWNFRCHTTARTWVDRVLRAEFDGKVFGPKGH
jgi:hypothetical protein